MIIHSPAKINLGLNITERRTDGYHNLQTVFFPVPIMDSLEIFPMADDFPSDVDCDIKTTNIQVEGNEQNNLVVKAYQLLRKDFPTLPRLHAHLHKSIPTQAGMGGGSSDGSAMLLLLNKTYHLGLSEQQLIGYATQLGADCPFFIRSQPAYAEGIGERLEPIRLQLDGWYLAIVRPDIPISTREAFSHIKPHLPAFCCKDIIVQPLDTWKGRLVNDFEESLFPLYPELEATKHRLYELGAVYAAMSGSGSAFFGFFPSPLDLPAHFPDMFTCLVRI